MGKLRLRWALLSRLERLIAIQLVLFAIFGILSLTGISLYTYF